MKNIGMKLNPVPFAQLRDGIKTVELRLCDEKRSVIEVGDIIVFANTENADETIMTRVIALHKYPTFKELLSSEIAPKCGFGNMSLSESVECMYKYYSKEQEKAFGALGIEIKLI